MRNDTFDYVIIHHHDFTKVDTLKGRFPDSKYCANSADIFIDARPNSNGDQFNKQLLEHYDFLVPDDYLELKIFFHAHTGESMPSNL